MASGDLIHSDADTNLITRRTGFSATVRDEFSLTGARGVDWYNGDLYTSVTAAQGSGVRRHNGFNSTVQESITLTNEVAFCFNNYGDLISAFRGNAQNIRLHEGFSTVVKATYNQDITGLRFLTTEQGQDLFVLNNSTKEIERHLGFSPTIKSATVYGDTERGPAFDVDINIAIADVDLNPNVYTRFVRLTTTVDTTFSETGWTGGQHQVFELDRWPIIRQSISY